MFGFAQDLDDDACLFFKKNPGQLETAKDFANQVLQKVGSSNIKVTFTGFSLGAALAQFTAIGRGFGERAVVFDSPPVGGLAAELYGHSAISKTPIKIYNALPNIINSYAAHTVNPTIVYKKGSVNLGFFPGGVLGSHSLAALDAFNGDGSLKPGFTQIQWPTNSMKGSTYHNIPEYRNYLYSQWLYQYRFDIFTQTPTYLIPSARNFRATFPTFESYLGVVTNKNQQKPK